jgi:hypothetical protein
MDAAYYLISINMHIWFQDWKVDDRDTINDGLLVNAKSANFSYIVARTSYISTR